MHCCPEVARTSWQGQTLHLNPMALQALGCDGSQVIRKCLQSRQSTLELFFSGVLTMVCQTYKKPWLVSPMITTSIWGIGVFLECC